MVLPCYSAVTSVMSWCLYHCERVQCTGATLRALECKKEGRSGVGAGSFCRATKLTFNLPLPEALGAGVSLNCPSMCPALLEGSNLNLQPAATLPIGFWGCVLVVLWGKVGREKALCSLIRTHKAKTPSTSCLILSRLTVICSEVTAVSLPSPQPGPAQACGWPGLLLWVNAQGPVLTAGLREVIRS